MIVVGVMAIAFGVSGFSGSSGRRGGWGFRFPIEDRVIVTIGTGLFAIGTLGNRPRLRP